MTNAVAVCAGLLALCAVLVLGLIGRRPVRRLPPAHGLRRPSRRAPLRSFGLLAGVAFLGGVAVTATGSLPFVVAVCAVAVVHRRQRRARLAARARAAAAAMPDAVELLVLCIHAGCSPTQAVVAVASRAPPPVRDVFAEVELGLHRGRTLAAALGALGAGAGPLGREVATAIAAAERDGLPLAPVLDRLAADARAARRRLAEADARRLPVQLTFPLVTCTLPAFVLLAIAPAVLGAFSTLRANAP
jgi:tight adherence protein C